MSLSPLNQGSRKLLILVSAILLFVILMMLWWLQSISPVLFDGIGMAELLLPVNENLPSLTDQILHAAEA